MEPAAFKTGQENMLTNFNGNALPFIVHLFEGLRSVGARFPRLRHTVLGPQNKRRGYPALLLFMAVSAYEICGILLV